MLLGHKFGSTYLWLKRLLKWVIPFLPPIGLVYFNKKEMVISTISVTTHFLS